jgi:eukaryotic-like serine/threonine-protein kinase
MMPRLTRPGKDGGSRRGRCLDVSTRTTSDRRVLGRYVMGPAIGRGATSVVHRAHDLVTGDDVAVKAIPVELDLAPRVRAEVRAAGRLDHPRIVGLRDWGEDRECMYLVWELVEGHSLSELLRDPGAAPGDGAMLRIAEDVLAALAHAHGRGVVHRDVKPANILVGGDGRARLSDFGVARLSGESGLTMTGGVVGTVAYMAPEQARGEAVGPAADVYAACLVLYEGLAGRNPVAAQSPAETARRAAAGAVAPLSRARPDLPQALCRAIDAGLRADPAARPSAADLADEMAGVRGGVRAARRRGARALPAVASAAGGAALVAVALDRGAGTLSDVVPIDWSAPGVALVAMAGGALAFAGRPRLAAVAAVGVGAALVAADAPAAGVLLGVVALAILLSGWRLGRLTLAAALGPLLFAIGLGPLVPALAGMLPRWPARLWTASAAVAATLVWQVAAGSGALLAGGGFVGSAVRELDGEGSPATAAERLWEPLAARPEAGLQALILVAAAMLVPLVLRAGPGGARVVAAAVWLVALGAALMATAADPAAALGAVVPAGAVVMAWAIRPWRSLRRHAPARPSATLRGPIV